MATTRLNKNKTKGAKANLHFNYFGNYSVNITTDGTKDCADVIIEALRRAGVTITKETREAWD